ncbi:MAG: hypothetical protein WBA91_04555 [Paracoccaceae bacterium]
MAGYSARPLAQKLGIRPGTMAYVITPPWPYAATVGIDSPTAELAADGPLPTGFAFLHIFSTQRAPLAKLLTEARAKMTADGMIWVSWPKKASKLFSEVTEDTVRDLCLPLGLVDVKVCAVDEVWSGLKLVLRKELRQG